MDVSVDDSIDESMTDLTNKENEQTNAADQQVKRRTLVGPWKNFDEFKSVYNWLFADTANAETRRRALSRMRVWSLRRSSLCPAAVLATSVILRVQIQDAEGAEHLQELYASAFTRFFNFMSSIMQTHNMRTMYDTANQLGLQSFVVDLRHICAHGQQLPPLELLRNTSEYCLSWLHDYYWQAQLETICDVDASRIRRKDRTKFDDDVSALFQLYDTAIECYLRGARNLQSCKKFVRGPQFENLAQFYEEKSLPELRPIFDALVKELSSLVKREIAIKDLVEIYTEAMLKMKYFYKAAHKQRTEKKLFILIDATKSLFRMLARHGFIEDVFNSLLQFMENPNIDDVRKRGASFWAQKIVDCFLALRQMKQIYKKQLDKDPNYKEQDFSMLNTDQLNKTMRGLLTKAKLDPNQALVFGDTTKRPRAWVFEREFVEQHISVINRFTGPVLKSLLPMIEPALSETDLNSLKHIMEVYLQSYIVEQPTVKTAEVSADECDANEDNDDTIYTVEDLIKSNAVGPNVAKACTAECTEFGIWSMVTDETIHNWKTCPLGSLPWQ